MQQTYRIETMDNEEIIDRLTNLFKQMDTKGKFGDTGYIANETRILAKYAIELIENFESSDQNVLKTKKRVINELNQAIKQTDKYYEKEFGYNYIENRNNKVPLYSFTNPTYNALELFISICDKSN